MDRVLESLREDATQAIGILSDQESDDDAKDQATVSLCVVALDVALDIAQSQRVLSGRHDEAA